MSKTRLIDTKYQGENERLAYVLDVTNWGDYASGATCIFKDQGRKTVTSTLLSGNPSVSGNELTSPLVISVKRNVRYVLYFQWVDGGGNTWSAPLQIIGEE